VTVAWDDWPDEAGQVPVGHLNPSYTDLEQCIDRVSVSFLKTVLRAAIHSMHVQMVTHGGIREDSLLPQIRLSLQKSACC
jgi:hypothetical protein